MDVRDREVADSAVVRREAVRELHRHFPGPPRFPREIYVASLCSDDSIIPMQRREGIGVGEATSGRRDLRECLLIELSSD